MEMQRVGGRQSGRGLSGTSSRFVFGLRLLILTVCRMFSQVKTQTVMDLTRRVGKSSSGQLQRQDSYKYNS